MRFIKRSEITRWSEQVIDEETGMTYLDYLEWQGVFDDCEIIEDEED